MAEIERRRPYPLDRRGSFARRIRGVESKSVPLSATPAADRRNLATPAINFRSLTFFGPHFAFDILHLDGADLRTMVLEKRCRELEAIVGDSGVQAPGEIRGDPDVITREARRLRPKGIVAKRRQSSYISGD